MNQIVSYSSLINYFEYSKNISSKVWYLAAFPNKGSEYFMSLKM